MQSKVEKKYQKKKNKMMSIINPDVGFKYKFGRDANQHAIVDLIQEGQSVLQAKYNLIGIYHYNSSMWHWAWNTDFVDKKIIKIKPVIEKFSKKLKKNFTDFDPKYAELMHFYMSNSSFFIDINNVPLLIKTAMYLSDSKWFSAVKHFNENISDEKGNHPIIYTEYILLETFTKFR